MKGDTRESHTRARQKTMTENLLVSLNDVEEKEASWLVPQRMPKGQIIILAGDGGSGKTSCWCSLAAAISTGAQVFFDETPKEFFESEPQKVLFFSSEDSLEYTLKARLRKAGANFNNIFSVDLKNERFSEIKFNSKLLKELIEQVKPALIVFDPLQAFIPVDMQMGQRNAMRACLKLTGLEKGYFGNDGESMSIKVYAEGNFLNNYERQYEKQTIEDIRISYISKENYSDLEAEKKKKAENQPVELVNADKVNINTKSTSEDSPAAKYAKAYSERMSTVNPEFE